MSLPIEQAARYSRHVSLPEIGEGGQAKLNAATILVVGAGGLGSATLLYLAAAGVGTIHVVDHDAVQLSNLQRQVIFETADIGRPKVEAAKDALMDLNPHSTIITHHKKLDSSNAYDLVKIVDIVIDGSDNFETRFLVNAACITHKKTLVSAAVIGFTAQLATFKPANGSPCYQCFVPELPPVNATPKCSESGVFGPLVGMLGCMSAGEAIKEILGLPSFTGRILRVDGKSMEFFTSYLRPDPYCAACGKKN